MQKIREFVDVQKVKKHWNCLTKCVISCFWPYLIPTSRRNELILNNPGFHALDAIDSSKQSNKYN